MFEILSNKQIEKVILGRIIGSLKCQADGAIYAVPISYAYNGRYIYVRSSEGLKVSMMRKDANASFQIHTIKDKPD